MSFMLFSTFLVLSRIMLFHKSHLVKEIAGITDLFNCKEHVSYVEADVAAEVRIEIDVTHRAFPYSVEVDSYEVSVSIDYRAA